jgi:hypothetical protein
VCVCLSPLQMRSLFGAILFPALAWRFGNLLSVFSSLTVRRVIGAVDEARLSILREADRILIEELHLAGVYR